MIHNSCSNQDRQSNRQAHHAKRGQSQTWFTAYTQKSPPLPLSSWRYAISTAHRCYATVSHEYYKLLCLFSIMACAWVRLARFCAVTACCCTLRWRAGGALAHTATHAAYHAMPLYVSLVVYHEKHTYSLFLKLLDLHSCVLLFSSSGLLFVLSPFPLAPHHAAHS